MKCSDDITKRVKLGIVQRCCGWYRSRPRLQFYHSVPAIKTHLGSWETVRRCTLSSAWALFWLCSTCCVWTPVTLSIKIEGMVDHIVCSYIAKPLHTSVCSPVVTVHNGTRGRVCLDDGKQGSSITTLYYLHVPKCRLVWCIDNAEYPHFCGCRPSTVMWVLHLQL